MRAARSLSHLSEGILRAMQRIGFAPADPATGKQLWLYHFQQRPEGPLIEIPYNQHSFWNGIQHRYGNAAGAG